MATGDAGTRALAEMAAWQEGRAAGMDLLLAHVNPSATGVVVALAAEARAAAAEYRRRHAAMLRGEKEARHG